MGAGFVILFWGVILGILTLIWVGLVALFVIGWKKKKSWLKWCAGIPAVLMLLVGVSGGGIMIYGMVCSTNPNVVFEDTFRVAPTNKITNIKSDLYWFADTGSVYLQFTTPEDEFQRLIPEGLSKRTMQQMKEEVPMDLGAEKPSWWTYETRSDWLYFLRLDSGGNKPSKRGFYSETEYYAFDPKSQTAYYRFLGID